MGGGNNQTVAKPKPTSSLSSPRLTDEQTTSSAFCEERQLSDLSVFCRTLNWNFYCGVRNKIEQGALWQENKSMGWSGIPLISSQWFANMLMNNTSYFLSVYI